MFYFLLFIIGFIIGVYVGFKSITIHLYTNSRLTWNEHVWYADNILKVLKSYFLWILEKLN